MCGAHRDFHVLTPSFPTRRPSDLAVEALQPFLDAHRHALAVALPDEPVFVEADLGRLVQVFGNLLNNAAKYTAAGGHVWLTVKREGDWAVIRSEEHTSELQSLMRISYAVFCLKKKTQKEQD